MAPRKIVSNCRSRVFPMMYSVCHLHSRATSFGCSFSRFKEVNEDEKSRLVGNVFGNVDSSYDLMNDLLSAGLHRLWKDRTESVSGMKHIDMAGGTGDVAFRILEAVNKIRHRTLVDVSQEETQIYVCDINPKMLEVGKKRAFERGFGNHPSLIWVEGDAEALKFEDNTMDGYTIAFGIRNVTHIEKVLAEAYRVLKRGGRFLCLELSHVETPVFKHLYDYYSSTVIPAIGELVAADRDSYQNLVESIRRFPSQDLFASMIADAGFQKVQYENLVGGVVAIHSGHKVLDKMEVTLMVSFCSSLRFFSNSTSHTFFVIWNITTGIRIISTVRDITFWTS
ncbi:2-methoxy-6-polyprenyl-1,4-benzoquinol methylase, mitochondrial-like protein [Drosera capensis]